MLDAVYVAATLLFFVLMFVYVRACARLGARTTSKTEESQ